MRTCFNLFLVEREKDSVVGETAKNIILIGLMGCGKSTIGRMLAKMLGYPFIDTDNKIEIQQKMTISNIFKAKGESHFRNLEVEIVNSLINDDVENHIISTGGGLPISEQARKLLPRLGYVVWLHASVETLHERTVKSNTRPLLEKGDSYQILKDLYQERKGFYEECAHLTINTESLDADDIATGILESARFHFSESNRNNAT